MSRYTFALLFVGFVPLVAMQLPVAPSSERRPMEESFFEFHAQADRRLNAVEGSVDSLENLLVTLQLDSTAHAGIEKVKRAANDGVLQGMVLHNEAKAAVFAREQQENNSAIKTDLEALQARLREQNRQQEAAQLQLKVELQQLRAGNEQLAVELAAQKSSTKKAYLVGGVLCIVAAGTAMYLGARSAQHDRDLYGCQEAEIKGLADKVTAIEDRPYVSKDHNNNLVYNAPKGSGPVRGAHVSRW